MNLYEIKLGEIAFFPFFLCERLMIAAIFFLLVLRRDFEWRS